MDLHVQIKDLKEYTNFIYQIFYNIIILFLIKKERL